MLAGLISFVEILQVNYLNNLIGQDHRFIKKITNPMMGFKAFHSAKATIDGIETAHMIRKGQLYLFPLLSNVLGGINPGFFPKEKSSFASMIIKVYSL